MSFDTPNLRCKECKFWWPLPHAGARASRLKSLRGQCRRSAPPAFLVAASEPEVAAARRPAWAITAKDDWCGDYVHIDYTDGF